MNAYVVHGPLVLHSSCNNRRVRAEKVVGEGLDNAIFRVCIKTHPLAPRPTPPSHLGRISRPL